MVSPLSPFSTSPVRWTWRSHPWRCVICYVGLWVIMVTNDSLSLLAVYSLPFIRNDQQSTVHKETYIQRGQLLYTNIRSVQCFIPTKILSSCQDIRDYILYLVDSEFSLKCHSFCNIKMRIKINVLTSMFNATSLDSDPGRILEFPPKLDLIAPFFNITCWQCCIICT